MSRTISLGNYLTRATPGGFGSAGTFSLKLRPIWSSGDSAPHQFLLYATTGTVIPAIDFEKLSDNNVYVGFVEGGNDARIIISDAGLFTAGVWATHIYTWDDVADVQNYYIDNVLAGTSSVAFTMPAAFDGLTLGANAAGVAPGDVNMAELARWTRVLTSAERAALNFASPLLIQQGLFRYSQLIGADSPEIEIIGGASLTLQGAPAGAAHPAILMPTEAGIGGVAGAPPPPGTPGLGNSNVLIGAV